CEGLSFLASNCSSDDQCGADEVCYDGYCALRCSDDTSCPENETCDASGHCVAEIVDDPDGGPQPKDAGQEDAGPDPLEVTLSADVTTVDSGAAVTLTWSSEPAAESCALYVETPFTSRAAVAGAPTTGADSLVVNPVQDSEYTIECTLGSDTADASVSVDVNAAGTLSATVTELNPEETTDLSWTANGVTSCELTGPGGFSYTVPSAETPSGSTTVSTPAAGEYALSCDGSSLATVTLAVASVTIDDVFPNALGPSAEVVTLTYTYVGPFPNSC